MANKVKSHKMVVAGYKAHMTRELNLVKPNAHKKRQSIIDYWNEKISKYYEEQGLLENDMKKAAETSVASDDYYVVLHVTKNGVEICEHCEIKLATI